MRPVVSTGCQRRYGALAALRSSLEGRTILTATRRSGRAMTGWARLYPINPPYTARTSVLQGRRGVATPTCPSPMDS